MIEPGNKFTSIKRQCKLLNINRSSLYWKPKKPSIDLLKLMNLIDEIFTDHPFFGKRSMKKELKKRGVFVGLKRVRRLMCKMGLESIAPKRNLSKPAPYHKIYPYLLRNMKHIKPNQVWASDITYIRLQGGFVFLVVIMDWATRKILSWRLSNTLDSDFCVEALEEALRKYPAPDIFNTDQGCQFTSEVFTGVLKDNEILISMDGRGRWVDNVMVERFWRTLKYEEVYPKRYESMREAELSIMKYIDWYNTERSHTSLDDKTPDEVYFKNLTMEAAA
jgi:putative transposase